MILAVHKYIRGAVQKKPCPLRKCKFLFVGEKNIYKENVFVHYITFLLIGPLRQGLAKGRSRHDR